MKPSLNCRNFELRIHQLLDDRLTLSGDPMLMNHASTCASCAQLVKQYEVLDSSLNCLAKHLTQPLSKPQTQSIHPAAASQPVSVGFADARPGLALGVAIAAALLLLIGFSFNDSADPQPQNVNSFQVASSENMSSPVLSMRSQSKLCRHGRRTRRQPSGFRETLSSMCLVHPKHPQGGTSRDSWQRWQQSLRSLPWWCRYGQPVTTRSPKSSSRLLTHTP